MHKPTNDSRFSRRVLISCLCVSCVCLGNPFSGSLGLGPRLIVAEATGDAGPAVIASTEFEPRAIYVSQIGTASDRNPGTPERPMRTIAAAVARAKPGDTVSVADGDYRQEDSGWGLGVIPVLRSGAPERPLLIQAAQGAKPIVSSFRLQDVSHVKISGFDFQFASFSDWGPWQDMPAIVRDEPVDPQRPIDFTQDWALRKPAVESMFATYFAIVAGLDYRTAIDVSSSQHVVVTGNAIRGYWAGIQCRGSQSVRIENNAISHCVNGIFTWQPSPSLMDALIQNNRITQCLDNGIDVREGAQRVQIVGNHVTYSGRSHISLLNDTRECLIEGNRLMHGGYYSESMEYPGSSAISVHSSFDTLVQNNSASHQLDLTGIDGNGLILDLMRGGAVVKVTGNQLFRNSGSGLNTTASPNAVIDSNFFMENGWDSNHRQNGAGIKLSRNEDVQQTIRNNVFSDNRVAGIVSYKLMAQQREINGNTYFQRDEVPLIWDGYEPEENRYLSLADVQRATPWERQGQVVREPPKIPEPPELPVPPETFETPFTPQSARQ